MKKEKKEREKKISRLCFFARNLSFILFKIVKKMLKVFLSYSPFLVNPRWIITSALAGYTSVAALSLLLRLGVLTTRL